MDEPKGDKIIKRRFPNEEVISLSSSCPIDIQSRSARSSPTSTRNADERISS